MWLSSQMGVSVVTTSGNHDNHVRLNVSWLGMSRGKQRAVETRDERIAINAKELSTEPKVSRNSECHGSGK
ncbi:hypothetical protein BDP55DRAFT_646811 [Colletotrichum godetiae]|uniref:Uncharacterized protein n=1 Tax=Colletotrichum godetiae TaxID=1209918 RepID=A0AAJ0AVX9_9PEZI|nr:uncharacterized protein BDP55DRAFT_646811 [Colletotrichum godetiae]KAK1691368.1 hypothetical protein BDP55DRAFT_646811 [Colletotrichum godetiae]